MPKILVTGAAGFIGYHLSQRLLKDGHEVIGFDNVNPYYDVSLKRARLNRLRTQPGFECVEADLADTSAVDACFRTYRPDEVVHLAAQAGVRHSLKAPHDYLKTNVTGFQNILDATRNQSIEHLLYASSSSVYGIDAIAPFSENARVDSPVSLYAATKRMNELMAHTAHHLYGLKSTGTRLFTVYGPWGRPDMAYWLFSQAIMQGSPLRIFNHGKQTRDFTYIDDCVEALVRLIQSADAADGARVMNIGSSRPQPLETLIATLESLLQRNAVREYVDAQPGDVRDTYADISRLEEAIGYRPSTSLETGLSHFVEWFLDYSR